MMMSRVRRTVMAVTAGAAGLSLTACSAGITTASQSPSVGRTASASAASTPGTSASTPPSPSASPVDTIIIDSPLRTFPIPSGAQIIGNITCEKETIIELGAVTVAKVSSFYNSVLPQDGYKITGNSMIDTTGDGLSGPAAEIQFTGHGYKGTISALSNFGSQMASAGGSTSGIPSDMTGNFISIDLIPPGAAGCPTKGP
jgi:hypothetical protein